MPVNDTGTFGVIETNPFGQFLPLSGGTMTGAVVFPSGTAALPSVALGQANSGFFRRTTNVLGLTVNGTQQADIAASTIRFVNSMVLNWGVTTASSTADSGISRVSAGVLGVGTGGAASTAGTLRAAALAAGGSDFTITAANSVSPTAPNRTITISYGGTTYYLAAKTTND